MAECQCEWSTVVRFLDMPHQLVSPGQIVRVLPGLSTVWVEVRSYGPASSYHQQNKRLSFRRDEGSKTASSTM